MSTAEIKEGATYQSGVDLIDNNQSTEEIPDVMIPPIPRVVNNNDQKNTFLYFDLETTGLGKILFYRLLYAAFVLHTKTKWCVLAHLS